MAEQTVTFTMQIDIVIDKLYPKGTPITATQGMYQFLCERNPGLVELVTTPKKD